MDSKSVARSQRQPQMEIQSLQQKTIVKIRAGNEPPLILIHVTPETPLHSLEAQASIYFKQIKEEQVKGPYRICSFSASSLIAVAIAKLLKSNGDTVEQLSFIDHFPTTFIAPLLGVDISRVSLSDPGAQQEFFNASVSNLVGMTHRDNKGKDAKQHRIADDLQAAYQGLPTSPFMTRSKGIMDGFLNHSLRHGDENRKGMEFVQGWLREVKAPVTVYLATYGILGLYAPDQYAPAEWNVHQSFMTVKITILEAGHYDILESNGLIRGLQEGYIPQRPARL
ncbi:hypothetical protein CVT25_015403 [Psilocybe cyanescens]|uniref:Thioesterase domain-containing protein n=1 Tax=Psilocybe cyanescens TaxID=93625 RepID=A0A409WHB3_PSICY|nr:hypothetical protein CVT25_015403 [Psilocybe cyanescens]